MHIKCVKAGLDHLSKNSALKAAIPLENVLIVCKVIRVLKQKRQILQVNAG